MENPGAGQSPAGLPFPTTPMRSPEGKWEKPETVRRQSPGTARRATPSMSEVTSSSGGNDSERWLVVASVDAPHQVLDDVGGNVGAGGRSCRRQRGIECPRKRGHRRPRPAPRRNSRRTGPSWVPRPQLGFRWHGRGFGQPGLEAALDLDVDEPNQLTRVLARGGRRRRLPLPALGFGHIADGDVCTAGDGPVETRERKHEVVPAG